MGMLRDSITYTKANFLPTLTDPASQRLISVCVDVRNVGSGRGQITANPRQSESLTCLTEAHVKTWFSPVELLGRGEAWRVHRVALK